MPISKITEQAKTVLINSIDLTTSSTGVATVTSMSPVQEKLVLVLVGLDNCLTGAEFSVNIGFDTFQQSFCLWDFLEKWCCLVLN
jgi:hypothetical protein